MESKRYQKIIDAKIVTTVSLNHTSIEEVEICLEVKAWTMNYGPFIEWEITCHPGFSSDSILYLHPFSSVDKCYFEEKSPIVYTIGEIVYDNSLVRELLKYITMSDEEMANYTGNTSTIIYRVKAIAHLADLWD